MLALFRKYFVAGLLVLIPLIGTLWILKVMIYWVEDFFLGLLPQPWLPEQLLGIRIPGVGLVITIVLVLVVGLLTRLVVARQILKVGEAIVNRIPVGRGVYQGLKQLLQLFVGQTGSRFSRVVLVEFPQPGTYTYGFVTSQGPEPGTIHVFVPTTPNPTTGYLFLLPEKRTRPAGLSVDQAMKLIISGGLAARS